MRERERAPRAASRIASAAGRRAPRGPAHHVTVVRASGMPRLCMYGLCVENSADQANCTPNQGSVISSSCHSGSGDTTRCDRPGDANPAPPAMLGGVAARSDCGLRIENRVVDANEIANLSQLATYLISACGSVPESRRSRRPLRFAILSSGGAVAARRAGPRRRRTAVLLASLPARRSRRRTAPQASGMDHRSNIHSGAAAMRHATPPAMELLQQL